jgi:hypothetical protein
MSAPYDGAMITALLRGMPPVRLAAATAALFQIWPAEVITPARVIAEMISNERQRRRAA